MRVSGLDYGAGEFCSSRRRGQRRCSTVSILVLHDTPYPAVDENGPPIHRTDPNHLDLRECLNSAEKWLHLIISGYLHVVSYGSIGGYEMALVVTGPTTEISTSTQENDLSRWLVTVSEREVQIERERLA